MNTLRLCCVVWRRTRPTTADHSEIIFGQSLDNSAAYIILAEKGQPQPFTTGDLLRVPLKAIPVKTACDKLLRSRARRPETQSTTNEWNGIVAIQ